MTEATSTAPVDRRSLREAIDSSAGTVFINRAYSRTFSRNIFERNFQELVEATRSVSDSDHGLRLMSQENREAGRHVHREINRLVHNFVAGAKSLIDHTRVFMQEHYEGTSVANAYKRKVDATFANNPVAKFVQDLRNYMMHKGMPNSEMFVHFDNTGHATGDQIETGIRYPTTSLVEWESWTAPAKAFLAAEGEYIDISSFAERYCAEVLPFHRWLDEELQNFHCEDLAQLALLEAALERIDEGIGSNEASAGSLENSTSKSEPDQANNELLSPFSLPPELAAEIDAAGRSALDQIRQLDFLPTRSASFPSERPVGATITPDQMVETPVVRRDDATGRRVVAFIHSGDETFGLDSEICDELQSSAAKILSIEWAAHSLSRSFIDTNALKWCREAFRTTDFVSLSQSLISSARVAIAELDIWVPIAYLEVESSFEFGPVSIVPMSKAWIDQLETKMVGSASGQHEEIIQFFRQLRSKMQGLAAVVWRVEAEKSCALKDGFTIAQNAVGLLRFFSPVARTPWAVCTTALLGSEAIATSNLLALGEDTFSNQEGAIFSPNLWQISQGDVIAMKGIGLDAVGSLVVSDHLDEFALTIRSSLLLFSTGTTFSNYADRLVYTLSAVENLLLRHEMEPASFRVEERLGLLLANKNSERDFVTCNAREIYRLRRRHGTAPLNSHEQSSVELFCRNAHVALGVALRNLPSFGTRADFIDAVHDRENIFEN